MRAEGVAKPRRKVRKGIVLMIKHYLQKFLGSLVMMMDMESDF